MEENRINSDELKGGSKAYSSTLIREDRRCLLRPSGMDGTLGVEYDKAWSATAFQG